VVVVVVVVVAVVAVGSSRGSRGSSSSSSGSSSRNRRRRRSTSSGGGSTSRSVFIVNIIRIIVDNAIRIVICAASKEQPSRSNTSSGVRQVWDSYTFSS